VTGPARILIIDDEAPIRRFLGVALVADGCVVTRAATARPGSAPPPAKPRRRWFWALACPMRTG